MASNHKHSCSICLDDFTQPKILPCFHTFCQDCLDGHIKVHTHLNKFNCPICRTETEVPKGGASGFTTNFYIEDIDNQQTCPKHKKLLLDLYCRDCSTPICYKCNVIGHENHKKADLDEVGIEAREKLATLKQKLEKEVKEILSFTHTLTKEITNINNSAARACDDVDKQVKKICSAAIKQGEDVKQEVIKIRDEECEKLRKLQEEFNKFENQLQTSVQCSDDALKREATIPVLDILHKVQTLADHHASRSLDYPEIRYPDFPMVDIDHQSLKQQLGDLHAIITGTLTSTFDTSLMKVEKSYYSNDAEIFGLTWYLEIDYHEGRLDIILYLRNPAEINKDFDIESSTIKLINKTDQNKSVVKTDNITPHEFRYKKSGMVCFWYDIIKPNILLKKDNHFVDEENTCILQTTIKINHHMKTHE
ncbi:tripartite motif-containing protein 2 [Patella vulgata]|uniref:tripartite motif-containing protein 2 n=1 Tax=Patella vulgata TaxID=6465 RepID=UPI0024A91C88|nr:tripartite motif-containing protein 2 [Patella vulgata]